MPCYEPPCDEYLYAAIKNIISILKEIEGKEYKFTGYDLFQKDLDNYNDIACSILKTKSKKEIKQYSIDVQCWWIVHQAHDKARLLREKYNSRQITKDLI